MVAPRVCVLRAPGTNCDQETAYAFDNCGAKSTRLHLFRLLEQPEQLLDYQILCIPGGFSYGDDIGAGVIFASHLRGHLGEVLKRFLERDTLTLGICNGFQTLLKSGILPHGADLPTADEVPTATLTWNLNGKYTARWVNLKVASSKNVFLKGLDELELPIAHAEGRIAVSDTGVIDDWKSNQQVAMRYHIPGQSLSETLLPAPHNPNGSTANIAGLGDKTGRVLGLMPHPERFLFGTQHPSWTRHPYREEGTGMQLFRNGVQYFG
ncbi:MAG: phosphoribosylformylglycinamidine synthase subunit PurQ [Planctomycetaceae bacterium]|nr:phosphoribosylformylglycinamidine synthase subunit PurQ [Planctomycetaceae bacterium]